MRRYGLPGEIIKRFKREAGAYAFEIKMIAALAPSLNKHPGGNGPWAEGRPVYPEFDRIIADIGARAYAARLWLACAKAAPHMVDLSKLDALKAVAYGSRV